MRLVKHTAFAASLAAASLVSSCTEPEVELSSNEQDLEGRLGALEFAIDAPWRLEPTLTQPFCLIGQPCEPVRSYGAIPIHIAILDAHLDGALQSARLSQVLRVDVFEESAPVKGTQTFTVDQLHEIQYTTGKWGYTDAQPGTIAPPWTLCRLWKGDACTGGDILDGRSEWQGTLMYNLRDGQILPGEEIRLKVIVWVSQKPTWCQPDPNGPLIPPGPLPAQWCPQPDLPLTNYLEVHLGEDVLPRFDNRWTYGDLHYHSQGTDNEGEAGYAHRAVIHAMAAIGMDWALASEHASSSAQLSDIGVDIIAGLLTSAPVIQLKREELRDMSQVRWNKLLERLNNPGGANRELTFPRVTGLTNPFLRGGPTYATPQLFLGGEVDVIPEMTGADVTSGRFAYGNGKFYEWDSCHALPDVPLVTIHACPGGRLDLIDPARGPGNVIVNDRFWLKDIQGPVEKFYGRNHLLHFPTNPNSTSAFIPSFTSTWGGAKRRFKEILDNDYAAAHKGLTFLAHPLAAASGNSVSRLGPDIVPYSLAQLDDAFRNPDVVGLQLWNEDNRLTTDITGYDDRTGDAYGSTTTLQPWFVKQSGPPLNYMWERAPVEPGLYSSLHHGTATWDRMLHWGIDPKKTAGLGLNGQPRRIFMGGGSDAHGDWNYRREGYMTGISEIVDTAIGKPRNLLFVGNPAGTPLDKPTGAVGTATPFSQGQIAGALRAGNFSVTDGPALRVVIDKNNDGKIDDGDVPMGGVGTFVKTGTLTLLVEWKSTQEFKKVQHVDLYVGVHSDVLDLGITYAPENHGVRKAGDPAGGGGMPYLRPDGVIQKVLNDRYYVDPTGKLRITVPSAQGYGGVAKVVLAPKDFPVGRLRFTPRAGCTSVTPCIPNPHAPGSCEPAPDDPPIVVDNCLDYFFDSPTTPDRFYVRAFARTAGTQIIYNGQRVCLWKNDSCIDRLVYTNPVWAQTITIIQPPNTN